MSTIDRREFVGLLAGGAAVVGGAGLTGALAAAQAAPASGGTATTAAPAAAGDWHVDEIFGPTPPCAYPVPHAMRVAAPLGDGIDPVDRALVL